MAMQAPADEALIGRIARGDRLAMQVLFARHHVRVYRFVLRLLRDEMAARLARERDAAVAETTDGAQTWTDMSPASWATATYGPSSTRCR